MFNGVTFGMFCTLYIVEMLREFALIEEMDVNVKVSNDASDVRRRMRKMDPDCVDKIFFYQNMYNFTWMTSVCFFVVNTALVVWHIYDLGK